MHSVWVVNGNDHREMWGPMFATEQEALAYAVRDADAKRKLWALDGSDVNTVKPETVKEVALGNLLHPTFWEHLLFEERNRLWSKEHTQS